MVLILVLVEDTLRVYGDRYSPENGTKVLILVLVEDTLRASMDCRKIFRHRVLILVLVEDTLRGLVFPWYLLQ